LSPSWHPHIAPLPFAAPLDQASSFEHAQVAGDCRRADLEPPANIADGQFASRQQSLDDRPPGRIGKRGEHGIEGWGSGHDGFSV
jgi:hypothetical protein